MEDYQKEILGLHLHSATTLSKSDFPEKNALVIKYTDSKIVQPPL